MKFWKRTASTRELDYRNSSKGQHEMHGGLNLSKPTISQRALQQIRHSGTFEHDFVSVNNTQIEISAAGRWYCVVTNPNCQRRAEFELAALGYRTFSPKLRKWITHARVRKVVERPLMGRYLFVHIDAEMHGFGEVRAINGVESLVGISGTPSVFPARQVEDLLVRQLKGEWDETTDDRMMVGARIRIMEGQFADMLATVTGVKGRQVAFKLYESKTYGNEVDLNVRAA